MFVRLRSLLELIRFSHTLFALPFALIAAALAWQAKPFHVLDLVGILLCMTFARSAAMAFNRLADRRLDANNPRTAGRHLPSGLLSPAAVGVFTLFCAAAFVASTLLFVHTSGNSWPLYLSVPVLAFIGAYSFTKRLHRPGSFLAGGVVVPGAGVGVDCPARPGGPGGAGGAGPGGAVLGGRLRHPLRLPGRRF